jgi:WD40 repeat protein
MVLRTDCCYALAAFLLVLLLPLNTTGQSTVPLPKMPQPDAILKDDRQFNAVKIGPGNTLTIGKLPDDFELSSMSFSPDGKALFIGWASGRLEEREISSNRNLLEFKAGETPVYDVVSDPDHHLLLVNTSARTIRFVDDRTGKQVRVVKEKAGKFKYDIQTIVVGPEAKWLAFATEDSGKVVSVDDGKIIADLGLAYDLILSRDGQKMWALYRNEIREWSISDWKMVKSIDLPSTPDTDVSRRFAVFEGTHGPVAFAGCAGGLVQVDLNSSTVKVITTLPTYSVAKSPNGFLVAEKGALHFYDPGGASLCRWELTGQYRQAVSSDGSHLAYRLADSISVWDMTRLLSSCPAQ